MSSSDQPPAGMETKGAATMLAPTPTAPTPDTATVTPEGVVELIAAVTGIQDDVGDIIRPGAFRRTIAERRPKVCSNHRWDQPIGRVLDIKELLPGDPRLPRTTGDGRAWPRAAGALVATAQLNMATKAGREAFEVIRFFGPPNPRSASVTRWRRVVPPIAAESATSQTLTCMRSVRCCTARTATPLCCR